MRYLGIDWGRRKVGLAIADVETRVAMPFGSISNDGAVVATIARIVAAESVVTVVVGVPRHDAHGNEGAAAAEFAAALRVALLGTAVVTADEMFTTAMARAARQVAGKRGGDDDANAACVLLQDWIDAR